MKELQITVNPVPKTYSEKVNNLIERLWNCLSDNEGKEIVTHQVTIRPIWNEQNNGIYLYRLLGRFDKKDYKVTFLSRDILISSEELGYQYSFGTSSKKSSVYSRGADKDERMTVTYEQQAIAFLESLVGAIKQTQKDTK